MMELHEQVAEAIRQWVAKGAPIRESGEMAIRILALVDAEKARGPDPRKMSCPICEELRTVIEVRHMMCTTCHNEFSTPEQLDASLDAERAALRMPAVEHKPPGLDPLLEQAREALEFDAQASEAAEQHDCGGKNECTYAQINFKGCFHHEIWDALKEAKTKKCAVLAALDARLGGKA